MLLQMPTSAERDALVLSVREFVHRKAVSSAVKSPSSTEHGELSSSATRIEQVTEEARTETETKDSGVPGSSEPDFEAGQERESCQNLTVQLTHLPAGMDNFWIKSGSAIEREDISMRSAHPRRGAAAGNNDIDDVNNGKKGSDDDRSANTVSEAISNVAVSDMAQLIDEQRQAIQILQQKFQKLEVESDEQKQTIESMGRDKQRLNDQLEKHACELNVRVLSFFTRCMI